MVPEEAQTDQTPLTLDLRKSEKVARGSIMVAMVSAEEVVREAIVQEPLQVDRKVVLQDADVADTEAVTKKEVSVVAVVDTKDPVMVASMEISNAAEVVVDVAVATAELQEVLTMETKLQCEKAVKPCHSLRVLMIEALSSKLTSKFQ